MKRFSETEPFKGQIEKISMMDFRKSPGEVVTAVDWGRTYILSKAGREIAVISKLPGETLAMKVDRKGKITHTL